MGNWFGCGGSWSGPSAFQRKKKTGTKRRDISVTPCTGGEELPSQDVSLHGVTSSQDTTEHAYEWGSKQPVPQERNPGVRPESSLHYADIQVCSHAWPRPAAEVKHLQLENASQYATLRFPRATPRYDSKNGTLV